MSEFEALFGREPFVSAVAPGRVNLIGEHTDYSGGFVLPATIPQRTRVQLARRSDSLVNVVSTSLKGAEVHFELGRERRVGGFGDYVQGLIVALRDAHRYVGGFDALVTSSVPLGAGVSSSAALEVSMLRAVRKAFGFSLDEVELARVAQRAENDFIGVPVGIMDPMACSIGRTDSLLFLDTRSLAYEHVAMPAELELFVIDSGVTHSHDANGYRQRRADCERAAALLGVKQLRDVSLVSQAAELPPPLDRRARHVISENARVIEAVACLRSGRWRELGALLNASHASLRDDFEVSTPDVDRLVALAQKDDEVLGARMTGGGFGGAIVGLTARGHGRAVVSRLVAAYDGDSGPRARALVPEEAS